MKNHVMKCFATGFISHFEYEPPQPWGHVENYKPVSGHEGEEVLRKAMRKEVQAGRMIGGPGWTADDVRQFFGGTDFYGIPCSATPKDGNPLGRIIHDYGYFQKGSYSINATHSSTSVEYIREVERVRALDNIT